MHFSSISVFFAALVAAAPATGPNEGGNSVLEIRADGPGTPYTCDAKYGAAAKKQALLADGATVHDIAVTMLET